MNAIILSTMAVACPVLLLWPEITYVAIRLFWFKGIIPKACVEAQVCVVFLSCY